MRKKEYVVRYEKTAGIPFVGRMIVQAANKAEAFAIVAKSMPGITVVSAKTVEQEETRKRTKEKASFFESID